MGVLDGPMRTIANVLINTFVDQPRAFKAETRNYNPVGGTPAAVTVETALLATSPVAKPEVSHATPNTKLEYDFEITVAALEVESKGFSVMPTTTRVVFAEIEGDYAKVDSAQPIYSGDQVACYILKMKR